MSFVKCKATTKAKVTMENFAELKSDYLLEIKNVIVMDEIPAQLVINFDQTGLNIVPTLDWTMEAEGSKRVEVTGKDDKRQLTAVLVGTLDGDFLPSQIIYQGTSPRCLPKHEFSKKWHITYSANHWSNEETTTEYLDNVLIPYIAEKRESLNFLKLFLTTLRLSAPQPFSHNWIATTLMWCLFHLTALIVYSPLMSV